MYLTENDYKPQTDNNVLQSKLEKITEFTTLSLNDLSDECYDEHEEVLVNAKKIISGIFSTLDQMDSLNKEDPENDPRFNLIQNDLANELDLINGYGVPSEFCLNWYAFYRMNLDGFPVTVEEKKRIKGDPLLLDLFNEHCDLLGKIYHEQLILYTLLKLRTDSNPNLVTEYTDYL